MKLFLNELLALNQILSKSRLNRSENPYFLPLDLTIRSLKCPFLSKVYVDWAVSLKSWQR